MSEYSIYSITESDGIEMGVYNPIGIELDNTDLYYKVEPKYENKPGRLAFDLFGSERLAWVFMYFNPDMIFDPIVDLKQGITIRVPTKDRLLSYF